MHALSSKTERRIHTLILISVVMIQLQNVKVQLGDNLSQGKKRRAWKVYEQMCCLFLEQ